MPAQRTRDALAIRFAVLSVLALVRAGRYAMRDGIGAFGVVQWAWVAGGLVCAGVAALAWWRASERSA